MLESAIAGRYATELEAHASLAEILRAAKPIAKRMPRAYSAMANEVTAILEEAFKNGLADRAIADPAAPPRLIRGWNGYNIVSYRGRFSAIPLAAGPLDLSQRDPETVTGAVVRDTYSVLYKALQSLDER